MKFLLLSILLGTLAFAQSYKKFAKEFSYETSYKQALKRAQSEKKDILLVQITNYCPWCRKLEKKVLAKEKIDTKIHKEYIPLIVNREEKLLPKRFDTPIVPVVYIIDYKDDKKFRSLAGYQGREDFMFFLQKQKSKK